MIEKYYFEFSKLYCRIMRLEMQMKQKLISSTLSYYKDNVIIEFQKFFYNKERLARYNHKTGNSFLAILKNPQIQNESQKFIKLVNIMYLSDILFLFLCCRQFRKPEIISKFYLKTPEKYGPLLNSRNILLELRNAIAHYNFRDFEQNRDKYIAALTLFESCMERNVRGFKEFPKFSSQPSVKMILLAIKDVRPDLFNIDPNKDDEMEYFYNKHRILLDLCDDIALFNGYTPNELPSPWTVLRQMYSINHNEKSNKQKDTDIYSLPLFSELFKKT